MLRFESLVEQEEAYLESLAVNGLYHNQIEFNQAHLTAIAQQFKEERDQPLPSGFEESLAQVSCLQFETGKRSNRLKSCQFLHLAFQEFFAAQSIAKAFSRRQSLALLKAPAITADAFIRQYKYDPRYEIVWWLLAGLLEKEALIQFFGLLDEDPQDLVGIQHQYLLMHCLRESHGKLPLNQQESLRCHLSAWLDVEIMTAPDLNSSFPYSYLGRQDAFPEVFLVGWLARGGATAALKQTVVNTLGERHSCSHRAIQALIRLLQDPDPWVRGVGARALGQQSVLAPEFMEAVIRLLQDPEFRVREVAAKALGQQSALAPAGVEALMRLIQDPDPRVREVAADALKLQSPLGPAGVEALIRMLQDSDPRERKMAAEALEQQSPLAPEFVEALIHLIQDASPQVRKEITFVLNDQDSWNIYRLLPTMNPSLLTAVYSPSMISYNFKQPAPIYLQSGVLHFYTPEGLETVPLKQEVPFKQAIVDAQQAIGIPTASQIRLQGSARRSSIGSYDLFFPIPGSWPVASQYEPSIRSSNCTKTP